MSNRVKFRPIYRYDAAAVAASLAVLAVVAYFFPTGSLLVRTIVGAVPAALVFAAFLVFRKSDDVLELEVRLDACADVAAAIIEASTKPVFRPVRTDMELIGTRVAELAVKCLKRDLDTIGHHVDALSRLANSFYQMTRALTGEIDVDGEQLSISEFRSQKIPGMIKALDDLALGIDETEAKKIAAAESDFETIMRLAELRNKAGETAKKLQAILEKKAR